MPNRQVILLDTNFLFIPYRFNLNLDELLERAVEGAYRVEIPLAVLREIKRMKEREETRELLFIKKLIDSNYIASAYEDPGGNVDLCLIKEAVERNAIIATNDKELIKRAKKVNIKILRLRSKKKLVLQ